MNNAPLTLILIASLGIVAVVSLGLFFALRPKGIVEDTFTYAADEFYAQTTAYYANSESFGREGIKKPSKSKKVHIQTGSSRADATPDKSPDGSRQLATPSSEPLPTTAELDALRAAPIPKNTASLEWDSKSEANSNDKFRPIQMVAEKDLHKYGKIVGLAYSHNKLFVPSYQHGNISVFSVPDMTLLAEYACPNKCHIYDMAVTSTGEMIVAQGKNEKLTKLDENGKFVKEIRLPYSTKGVALSQYDEIFVLPKQHNTLYVYDAQLNELGVIPLPLGDLAASVDCNFLDYAEDTLYVSCEPALYAVDIQGNLKFTAKPSKGTFGIGVAVDRKNHRALVGLRGSEAVDIFDVKLSGAYLETVGESKDSLWSDIVADDGNFFYAVDYISATVKVYRYRA